MFRTAVVQTHNLSMAGSTEKTTYNVALNFVDQPGTMRGFKYRKYNATIDLTARITNFIKVGTYANLMYGETEQPRQGQNDAFLSTLSQAPTYMLGYRMTEQVFAAGQVPLIPSKVITKTCLPLSEITP